MDLALGTALHVRPEVRVGEEDVDPGASLAAAGPAAVGTLTAGGDIQRNGADDVQELVLTGEATPVPQLLRGLARHWRLLPMLARQDFRARYRSASLGLLWSVALPLLQGVVLAAVFTRFVRIQTDVPYPVFVLAGITTWSYLSASLTTASGAIVDTGGLASRIYFPRLLLPAIAPAANAVGFAIALGVVIVLLPFFDVALQPRLLLLPFAIALAALLVYACGALGALLHVYFRDTRYVVTAAVLILFYATPVIYPLELAGGLAPLLAVNPFTGVVQLVRWCLLGRSDGLALPLLGTAGWLVVLLAVTALAYRRHERVAVDRL